MIDSQQVYLGVYDWSVNGRFDEEQDVLVVDLDGNGKLEIRNDSSVFNLNEVFKINDNSYRLTHVDRYGRGIRMVKVEEEPDQLYLEERKKRYAEQDVPVKKTEPLDSTFWHLALPTISGDTLYSADYRDKHILLNLWGEWCAPCLMELPELVAAQEMGLKNELIIIGLLQAGDLDAANAVMRQYNVKWPQVELSTELREMFDVRGFPTNILIQPNNTLYKEAGMINAKFIKEHVDQELHN